MSSPDSYFDKGHFVPMALAEEIMRQYHFVTHRDSGEIFVYIDGVYKPVGEAWIRHSAQEALDDETKTRHVNEVVDYIRRATYKPPEEFDHPPNLLNLKNGVLDLNKMELKEHSENPIFITQLQVKYDPNATCPEIDKFLCEILRSDDIEIVLELFGYCLYCGYPIQKAFLFVGDGANGKSTLIILFKVFLGVKNVSGRALQDLEDNRFATADLYGKLANLYPDLPDTALLHTGRFKMLTGGDPISGERKFRNSFIFTNYAKLIFSANKVPEAYDESGAFFRRWVIIDFPNKFEGDKADTKKIEKITTTQELSGLLNKVLAALKGLLERGEFSHSKTTEEIKQAYIRLSSPIGAFVMDRLEVAPEKWIPKKALYAEFCAYCRGRSYPTVAESTFHKNLQQYVRMEDYKPLINGKRIATWRGTRLREVGQKKEEKQTELAEHLKGSVDAGEVVEDIPYLKSTTECSAKEEKCLDKVDTLDIPVSPPKHVCDVCGVMITGATVYAEDGARLCEKCAKEYGGRI